MSSPYVGEIRMFAGNFAPVGWALCQGQVLSISENDILFNLIGTTYGGDGQTTFALPDLRGRFPMHMGQGPGTSNRTQGQTGGVETVTLSLNQIPAHSHVPQAVSRDGNQRSPTNNSWAASQTGDFVYSSSAPTVQMNAGAIGAAGGSQPHDNMAPYVAVNFIISLYGVYPTQA